MWRKIIFILTTVCISNGWFYNNDTPESVEDRKKVQLPESPAPFELKTADEQFLMQAEFTRSLSPLDLCHHMVISEIEGTCTDLSEEGLNKLAVMLLNCQSQAEGRPTYMCTRDMPIGECTKHMDGVTWNAYQIVASRARAVCYATRQQHFRAKTEWTVNKLLAAAGGQAKSLAELQSQQEEVASTAAQTLQSIEAGQAELAERQRQLNDVHQVLHGHISTNLRDLQREKALIAAGHGELARMTEDIKDKLDETSARLAERWTKEEENHAEVADGLDRISHATHDVLHKIDDSSRSIKQLQNETDKHYKDTLENLEKVNNTIHYVLSVVQETREAIETKLNWVLSLVGGTGERVSRLCTLTLHLAYLLLAVVCSSFLHTPTFSRVMLLVLVPVNCWAELHGRPSLAFLPMTAFITLTTFANWATSWMFYIMAWKSGAANPAIGGMDSSACLFITPAGDQNPADNVGLPDVDGRRQGNGLSIPEVRQLIETLEKLTTSGVRTPSANYIIETTPPEPPIPFNTPVSNAPATGISRLEPLNILNSIQDENDDEVQITKKHPLLANLLNSELLLDDTDESEDMEGTVAQRNHLTQKGDPQVIDTSFITEDEESDAESVKAAVAKDELDVLKGWLPSKNTPKIGETDSHKVQPSGKESPNLSVVRRHLLKSGLATPPRTPRTGTSTPGSSRMDSRSPTPSATSHWLTPVRTSGGRTPGRGGGRPACLASTKAGWPCKNLALDGSSFCHKHQTTPLRQPASEGRDKAM